MIFIPLILSKFVIRKEIRDMTKNEWIKYKNAFNLFNEKGYLADIAKIHVDVDNYAHKNGRFLPWHRMLLLHVESILQMLTKDPEIYIPYWDWSVDASDPSKSLIFTDEYWGLSECYKVSFPNSHCLQRKDKNIDPFYGVKDIERLINSKGTYNEFRDILELVPHALVHENLSGDMGQMFSPNDPIFWHHHSFIDYIWHQKQIKGLKNQYEGTVNNKKLDIEERLYPFNRQVKDVLDLKKCKIKYKPFKIVKIQSEHFKPSELSAKYIKLHNYNEKNVRKYEKYMRGEIKKGILRKIWEWFSGNYKMT